MRGQSYKRIRQSRAERVKGELKWSSVKSWDLLKVKGLTNFFMTEVGAYGVGGSYKRIRQSRDRDQNNQAR